MKSTLVVTIVVLMALILTPVAGFAQTEQQGANLLKEGIEIKNKAKSRADFERSLKKLEASQQIFEKVNSEQGQAYALGWIGQVYKALDQYAKALEYFGKSIAIARRIGSPKEEGITLNEMAGAYNSLGDYAKALDYYEKSLAIIRRIPDPTTEGAILNNMGLVYRSLGKYDKALESFDRSLAITRKINDVKGEGSALNNMGLAYQSLGKLDKALEHYDKSLEIRKKTRDVSGEGDTLNNIGDIFRSKAQYEQALDQYEKSLAIKSKIGDLNGEGTILNNIGLTYYLWGQYTKALDYYDKSLTIRRKISDVSGESTTLNNIAGVYDARGQYENALEFYEKSLAINRKTGDVKGESTALNNMGLVYKSLGRYALALECLEKSLDIRRKIGDVKGEGITLNNIADLHVALGQYAEALENAEKSLRITKKTGDVKQEGETLNSIGQVYKSSGQYDKALKFYEESLEITKKIGDAKGEATTLGSIGRLRVMMGRYDDAEKDMNENMTIFDKLGIPSSGVKDGLANLYLDTGDLTRAERLIRGTNFNSSLGRLAFLKSDYPSASEFYEKDVDSAQKTGDVDSLFRSCTGLARVYEEMDKYSQAEEYFEKATNLTEDIRSGLPVSERKNFFEVKTGGFTRSEPAKGLTRVRMRLNHAEASITSSELTKARSFSDHLSQTNATGATDVPSGLMKEEQSCVNKLVALKKELAKTDRVEAPEKFENLSKAVKQAKDELNSFVDRLRRDHPAYAAVKYPKPVSLKETALRPDEYVVIFDVSNQGVGVKLLANREIKKAFFHNFRQTDLEKDVASFRKPLQEQSFENFDVGLARSLYDRLLRQVLSDVPKGAPIIIVPDGVLSTLPFEALVTRGEAIWSKGIANHPYPAGLTFLVDEHFISYYQSLTALTLVRTLGAKKSPSNRMLVLADPIFEMQDVRLQGSSKVMESKTQTPKKLQVMLANEEIDSGVLRLPRLKETTELANNLSKMYGIDCSSLIGMTANKADFMSQEAPKIDRYGAIVFATHGSMNHKTLREPFLALSMVPPGTDGYLTMSDVLSLKMNADIVALTACQTALGQELSGEGVMSMGRAFQYAGAKSVLMTLWEAATESSVKLTESFFRHRKNGKTKLEALQAARDDIRNEGYKHPYFWSAFILVGETS